MTLVLIIGVPAFFFALWFSGRGSWRAWRFLARYHHDGTFLGYIKTLPRVLEVIQRAGKSVTTFEAALMQTEIDILMPPEKVPSRFEAEEHFDDELAEWRATEQKRIQNRGEIFGNLIRWKGLENDRLRASKGKQLTQSEEQREAQRPIIFINNPAVIDNSRAEITRYFKVAKTLPNFQDEFQSFVEMNDGFFAPLYLVSGLMSRFDEDWSPVINNYRSQIKDATQYTSRELMELQSFEFNCWLLWGPSIPLCNCTNWSESGASNQNIDSLFYQYGYGDENNSIDVFVENGRSPQFRELVKRWLSQSDAADAEALRDTPCVVAAAPRSLVGKINYGPSIDKDKVCKAQSAIGDEKASRLFLRLDKNPTKPGPSGSQYYSAYIWVMLVVCDKNGDPIYKVESERWRNLLPFFEHGNIADATTMQSLKENLAAKVVNALKEILTRPIDAQREIGIRYACAFDDSNCSDKHGVLFPHDDRPIAGEISPFLDPANKPRPFQIVRLIEEMASWDLILSREIEKGRLILQKKSAAWPYKDSYSSCHLPEVIDAFFDAVDESKQAAAV